MKSKSKAEVITQLPKHEQAARAKRADVQRPKAGSNEKPARPFSKVPAVTPTPPATL